MRIKIDFKSFTMIFMLFILLISCSPSGNTIPADENNQSPPKEELSSSSIVFSISHNQFEAEKSILACLNLLNNNNEIIVDGILSDDYIFDDITIKKGSKVYFSSLSTSRNLMDKIENIDIALKVTTDEKTFDVKYLGTISDNKIETEIFNVDNEEFSSTPASLICSTDIDSLYSLIKDFCLGKEPSEEFKIYKDESFLDSWKIRSPGPSVFF